MQNAPRTIRRGPRLILALFLGAAAAAGVYLYVGNIQQAAQQNARAATQQALAQTVARSKVVVAKVSLPAQTVLSADNVELREVGNDAVQPNVATALGDVLSKALTVPVAAGEQIVSHRLANPTDPTIRKLSDLVPAGKRAMSVTFTEVSSAGGLIAPGDYVDVIAVFNKNTMGKDQSMIRSEEHTSELQSRVDLVCRLLLERKK